MSDPPRVRLIDLQNPFADLEGMCEILLVRHGEQAIFSNISLGDAYDAPLSDLGQQQVAAVAQRLQSEEIHAVYASPLQRAHDTGRAIGAAHGLDPTVIDDLREIDLWQDAPQEKGLRDLYDRDQLAAIYREVNQTRNFSSFPHTEPPDLFKQRVISALDAIVDQHHGHRVAVACHGGVINAVLSELLASDVDNLIPVHHTSVTRVRAAGSRRVVLSVNDYAHVHSVQTARGDMNA
jgi:probable phosphoglycerate mutase